MDGFSAALLAWYDTHQRILPWRENTDPYRVWVSEIMLQQTRVTAAIPYYERFLSALPSIRALAEVDDDRLKKLWEGLGYYSRAKNLKAAAMRVVNEFDGKLPADFKALQTLPGIGEYTASAIGSIAFGLPTPTVDGNVLRVLARLRRSHEDVSRPQTKRAFTEDAATLLDPARPGDFNQAMMELGAMVCLPNGAPLCDVCPVSSFCASRGTEDATALPVKPEKPARTVKLLTVLVLVHENKILIRRRPETGLLAGMWEFPTCEGHQKKKELEQEFEGTITPLGRKTHIFTHIEWHMIGFRITCEKRPALPGVWVTEEELSSQYALPAAFGKYRNMK